MKIDTSSIPDFETMSAEDKVKALMEFEIEDKENGENDAEYQKMKNLLNKANSQASEYKKMLREKQTEAEREAQERAEKDAEKDALLKSLMREKEVSGHTAEFLAIGFDTDLAKKSAEALADGDSKSIFANLKSFIENHDKGIKAEVLKQTPSPVPGSADKGAVTKEQFDKMGYTELVKFKTENPELYQELSQQ